MPSIRLFSQLIGDSLTIRLRNPPNHFVGCSSEALIRIAYELHHDKLFGSLCWYVAVFGLNAIDQTVIQRGRNVFERDGYFSADFYRLGELYLHKSPDNKPIHASPRHHVLKIGNHSAGAA